LILLLSPDPYLPAKVAPRVDENLSEAVFKMLDPNPMMRAQACSELVELVRIY